MKTDIDWMCLYWTTVGVVPGEGEIGPYDFRDRVESALDMVKAAEARNGGLIIDIVQVEALRMPREKIANIPLQHRAGRRRVARQPIV